MRVSRRWDSRKKGARRPPDVEVWVMSSASVPQGLKGHVSLSLTQAEQADGGRPCLYLSMEVAEAEDLRRRLDDHIEWCRQTARLQRLEGRQFELDGQVVHLGRLAADGEIPPDRWPVIETLEVGQEVQLAGGAFADVPLRRVG